MLVERDKHTIRYKYEHVNSCNREASLRTSRVTLKQIRKRDHLGFFLFCYTERMYPTYDEIVRLHHKYAPNDEAFDVVFTHSKIVSEIAAQLLRSRAVADIDGDFIKAACLLHDIGVYQLYGEDGLDEANYITHGILGEAILKSENIDPKLCRIAAHHTGVGISREQIVERNLPLPHKDYFAESDEEELVMYADKYHSKTPKFNTFESYLSHVSVFSDRNSLEFRRLAAKYGVPDLEELSRSYGHPLV